MRLRGSITGDEQQQKWEQIQLVASWIFKLLPVTPPSVPVLCTVYFDVTLSLLWDPIRTLLIVCTVVCLQWLHTSCSGSPSVLHSSRCFLIKNWGSLMPRPHLSWGKRSGNYWTFSWLCWVNSLDFGPVK